MKEIKFSEQDLIDLELCYPGNQLSTIYTKEPQAEMVVSQVLALRQEIWKKIASSRNLLLKRIIITDWSAKVNNVIHSQIWKALFKLGCKIYVWQGKLVPVSNIAQLNSACKNIEPISKQGLTPYLAEFKKSGDEIEIFDYFKMRDFLSKVIKVIPKGEFTLFTTSTLSGYHSNTYIFSDFFVTDKNYLIKILQTVDTSISVNIKGIYDTEKTIDYLALISQRYHQIDTLSLSASNLPFTSAVISLFNAQRIELRISETDLSNAKFDNILSATYPIKKLELFENQLTHFLSNNLQHSPSHLEDLSISHSEVYTADLATLLKQSPKLQDFSLIFCNIIDNGFNLENNSLNALQTLTISSANLSLEKLSQLINAAPNLKKLFLLEFNVKEIILQPNITSSNTKKKYVNQSDVLTLNTHALHQAEELHLEGVSFDNLSLARLLKNCPSVRNLSIKHAINITGDILFRDIALDNLIELSLELVSFSIASLTHLLDKCPNLQILNLQNLSFKGQCSLSEKSLSSLINAKFIGCKIEGNFISEFFKHATKLIIYDFRHCEFHHSQEAISHRPLHQLKEISWQECKWDGFDLFAHLNMAPNVTSIEINSCKLPTSKTVIPKPFNNLSTLILYGVEFTHGAFSTLITSSKNLTCLRISNCYSKDAFFAEDIILSHLKELSCSNSNISYRLISHLIQSCTDLNKLDIEDVSFTIDQATIYSSLDYLETLSTTGSHLNVLLIPNNKITTLTVINLTGYTQSHQFSRVNKLVLTGLVNTHSLSNLLTSCPQLTELQMSKVTFENTDSLNSQTTNNTAALLFSVNSTFHQLKSINFSNCDINDVFINWLISFINQCPNIHTVHFFDGSVGNFSVQNTSNPIINIPKLSISNLQNMTELLNVLSHFFAIHKLTISLLGSFGGVRLNIQNLNKLKKINLPLTDFWINGQSLVAWAKQNPHVGIFIKDQSLAEAIANNEQRRSIFLELNEKASSESKPHTNTSARSSNKTSNTSRPLISQDPGANNYALLDSDTEKSEQILNARQYFVEKGPNNPALNHLRLDVFDSIRHDNNKIVITKTRYKIVECPFKSYPQITDLYYGRYHRDKYHFLGQITLTLSDKWSALPSLRSNENILYLNANNEVKLGYAKEIAIHFVKAKYPNSSEQTTLQFILQVIYKIYSLPNINTNTVEALIQALEFNDTGNIIKNDAYCKLLQTNKITRTAALVKFCKSFTDGKLNKSEFTNGYQLINAVIKDKKGHCRHRTYIFMILGSFLGINARDITNDIHQFIELEQIDQYYQVELGGTEAQIKIEPLHVKEIKPIIPEDNPNRQIESKTPIGQLPAHNLDDRPSLSQNLVAAVPALTTLNNIVKKPLLTWNTVPPQTYPSLFDYFEWVTNKAKNIIAQKRNCFVALPTAQDINDFNIGMIAFCATRNIHQFYLPGFNQLIKNSVYIKDTEYELIDGPFLEFIKKAKEGDIILINWSDFEPAFVGYNTVIDKIRKLYNANIAAGVIVIGLLEANKILNFSEDYYSRFGLIDEKSTILNIQFPRTQFLEQLKLPSTTETKPFPINLFYGVDWEKDLLGYIHIAGINLSLHSGKLIKALNKDYHNIELINAPLHLPEFQHFLAELINKKQYYYNGTLCNAPSSLKIICSSRPVDLPQNYSVELLNKSNASEWQFSLNASSYQNFLKCHYCENHKIFMHEGWLKQLKNQHLTILVTENLSLGHWQKLLIKANKYHCKLRLILAKNIVLPTEVRTNAAQQYTLTDTSNLNMRLLDTSKTPANNRALVKTENALASDVSSKTILDKTRSLKTVVIYSDDTDFTTDILSQKSDFIVRYISASTDYSHLFENIIHNRLHGKLSFDSIIGTVWEDLSLNKTVIISGYVSDDLAAKLETLFSHTSHLWINGNREDMAGRLIIVSSNKTILSFTEQRFEHLFNRPEFLDLLSTQYAKEYIAKLSATILTLKDTVALSYIQMKSILKLIKDKYPHNPVKPFFYLDHQADKIIPLARKCFPALKGSPANNLVIPESVNAARFKKIMDQLVVSPYVFVAGISGIAKSSFILNEFRQYAKGRFFIGLSKLSSWIEADEDQENYLILDEANTEKEGAYDIFENFFCGKPGIFHKSKYKEFKKNKHKVICLGNFSNQINRYHHSFFVRHGGVITFKHLPDQYIQNYILIPLLKKIGIQLNDDMIKQVCELFLTLYHQANSLLPPQKIPGKQNQRHKPHKEEISDSPNIITIRNLKMACLRLALLLQQQQQIDPAAVNHFALYIFYSEVKNILVDKRKNFKNWLKEKYQCDIFQIKTKFQNMDNIQQLKLPDFTITPSRHSTIQFLLNTFAIRKWLANSPELFQSGINGILIEGPSGIGKSCLLMALFNYLGIPYYYLTPTDPQLMEEIVVKAFHEGGVLFIDEINTLPLDAVLGKIFIGVDLDGNKAGKPGLLIVATQNSLVTRNRRALSTPLENWFTKIYLPDYPTDELELIVASLGVSQQETKEMVEEFTLEKGRAIRMKKLLIPTPRDLFDGAKQYLFNQSQRPLIASP